MHPQIMTESFLWAGGQTQSLDSPNINPIVSKGTVQHSLYQEGYNKRVVKKKVRIREVNRKKRVKWSREKLHVLDYVYVG
jgi:hypothetical protein